MFSNIDPLDLKRYQSIDKDPRLLEIKKNHPWSKVLEEWGGKGWAITFALGFTQLKKNIKKDIALLSELPEGYTLSKLGDQASVSVDFFPPNFRHRYDKKFLEDLNRALDNVLKNSDLEKEIVLSTTMESVAMFAVAYTGGAAAANLEGYDDLCWRPADADPGHFPCLGATDWKTEYFRHDDVMDLVYGRRKGISKDDPLHFVNWTSPEAYRERW